MRLKRQAWIKPRPLEERSVQANSTLLNHSLEQKRRSTVLSSILVKMWSFPLFLCFKHQRYKNFMTLIGTFNQWRQTQRICVQIHWQHLEEGVNFGEAKFAFISQPSDQLFQMMLRCKCSLHRIWQTNKRNTLFAVMVH